MPLDRADMRGENQVFVQRRVERKVRQATGLRMMAARRAHKEPSTGAGGEQPAKAQRRSGQLGRDKMDLQRPGFRSAAGRRKMGGGGLKLGPMGPIQKANESKSPSVRVPSQAELPESMTLAAGEQTQHTCAGCDQQIRDRFLLNACNKFWHQNCLKCDRCQAKLGELGTTCYEKGNMNLCRQDYFEMFGQKAICAICEKLIYASEMVMRARQNVYHLECFACQLCGLRFCVGDRFHLFENKIVCQYDYDEHILPIQESMQFNQQQEQQPQQHDQPNNKQLGGPQRGALPPPDENYAAVAARDQPGPELNGICAPTKRDCAKANKLTLPSGTNSDQSPPDHSTPAPIFVGAPSGLDGPREVPFKGDVVGSNGNRSSSEVSGDTKSERPTEKGAAGERPRIELQDADPKGECHCPAGRELDRAVPGVEEEGRQLAKGEPVDEAGR